jgi:hypothetical protein
MTTFSVVELDARSAHETAIVAKDGTVWIAIAPAWWGLVTWLWWWLCPLSKKAWMTLKTNDCRRIRSRVVRVARTYMIIGQNASGGRA